MNDNIGGTPDYSGNEFQFNSDGMNYELRKLMNQYLTKPVLDNIMKRCASQVKLDILFKNVPKFSEN